MFKVGDLVDSLVDSTYLTKGKTYRVLSASKSQHARNVLLTADNGVLRYFDSKDFIICVGIQSSANAVNLGGANTSNPLPVNQFSPNVGDFIEALSAGVSGMTLGNIYQVQKANSTGFSIIDNNGLDRKFSLQFGSTIFRVVGNISQQSATQSNQTQSNQKQSNQTHNYSPGDDVECLVDRGIYLTKGHIYVFSGWPFLTGHIMIERDNVTNCRVAYDESWFKPYKPYQLPSSSGSGQGVGSMGGWPTNVNITIEYHNVKTNTGPECHCGNKDNPIGQGHSDWCDRYEHEFI